MARGINDIHLLGNLGNDPELRYTPAGVAHTSASLAVNDEWYDAQGEKQERVDWFRLVFFDRRAETFAQYAYKGRPVYVNGPLRQRPYTDRNGTIRTAVEVHVRDYRLMGDHADKQRDTTSAPEQHAEDMSGWGNEEFEDIPF